MQLISFPNYITVCDSQDLLLPGVEWGNLSLTSEGGGVYSFSGGNVTFDGVSLGSTATYLTNEHYHVNGSQSFTSSCDDEIQNWVLPSARKIVGGEVVFLCWCYCVKHAGCKLYWLHSCTVYQWL